jgi:hypothetical protein
LEEHGYELVPFNLTKDEVEELTDNFCGFFSDNFGILLNAINSKSEILLPSSNLMAFLYNANCITRKLINTYLYLSGNQRIARSTKYVKPLK